MSLTVARNLAHALDALNHQPPPTVLAGGTDLMVEINFGHTSPTNVLAIDRVPELKGWQRYASMLRVGAGVTYRELERGEVASLVPALAHAARTVGSPQIRNAGTIGGNVATGSPAGDTLPVLAALDASVELHRSGAVRVVPWNEFFTGPKRTARAADELVVAVHVPIRRGPHEYLKVGTRNAMVIAVASVCLVADLDEQRVRCGLGSVGPLPLRAVEAEQWVSERLEWSASGVAGDESLCREFGARVAAAARPIDDHRGTAAYRRHAVGVCAARGLRRAIESARTSQHPGTEE